MVLREIGRPETKGERIAKIASSFVYVGTETPVHAILEEMKEPRQSAIAVVNAGGGVEGIIVPQDLVEMLGKPFGRDLLQRQQAKDIMRKAALFNFDAYIQEIRERIRGDLEKETNTHYILTGDGNAFQGIFSAQDILRHSLEDHRRELNTAMVIQGRLVHPYYAVRNDSISITCSSVMAQGVGGDYYFVKEYEKGKWFFCLCDISGKGMAAAIITAVLSGFMYNADFASPLETIVGGLNRIVYDTFKLEKYLTGFFARFSEKDGTLEYCDMGHAFFYVVEGPSVQQISAAADNLPVGLVESPAITAKTLRIPPGTVLLLLSDGILEQENKKKELYPLSKIGRCIDEAITLKEDLVRAKVRILESFFAFKKDVPQHDDISMLLFQYKGKHADLFHTEY
jgi:sigma-B regulation protein RsbU (phosphoserine phosphatase)